MENILGLWQLAFPLLLGGGAIAAWRMSKRNTEGPAAPGPKWRDDSLDDWRKERDAKAEAHRTERAASPDETTGRGEEQAQEKRHQRIGG